MNKGNIILSFAALLVLIMAAITGAACFNRQNTRSQVFLYPDRLKVKNLNKLYLINYCFQHRINIYSNTDDTIRQIEAVALVPVQVEAYIDFGAASFATSADSALQKITLPQARFDTIKMIDKNELLQNKKQYLIMGNAGDAELWQSFQSQTNMNSSNTCLSPCASFLPQADSIAAGYVRSVLNLMNYQRHDFTVVFADSAKR